ncbi:hypothetical protein HA466_0014440 [Hirschfeldia incana]|nr:hypothetical protein HA466_0014440 [Hirschfeldia incana]
MMIPSDHENVVRTGPLSCSSILALLSNTLFLQPHESRLNRPTMAESTVKHTIKLEGRLIPLSVSPDAATKDLKSLLQPITNVLPRGQKLIFKGSSFFSLKSLL